MVVDRSNYTFFLNRYNKRNLLVWFSTTSKQLLNFNSKVTFRKFKNPCTNYHVTPRFPVQDVTRQQFETLILGQCWTIPT